MLNGIDSGRPSGPSTMPFIPSAVLVLALLWLVASGLLTSSAYAEGSRIISYRQVPNAGIDGKGGTATAGMEGHSTDADISEDGRWVVFSSKASYFDTLEIGESKNSQDSDIFLHDVTTGETVRVSFAKNKTNVANGASSKPSISPNGEWVAFESEATDLTKANDSNGNTDVFRYNAATKDIKRVSVRSNGPMGYEAKGGDSFNASVADNGAVAFESAADDMSFSDDDENNENDVYIHKLYGPTELVSIDKDNPADGASGNASSGNPSISGNGEVVAFESLATDLVASPTITGDAQKNIFTRDLAAGKTELVSIAYDGMQSNGASVNPAISYTGKIVAFQSLAGDLLEEQFDSSNWFIFIRDLGMKKTVSGGVGKSPDISQSASDSSNDGRYLVKIGAGNLAYFYDTVLKTPSKIISMVSGGSTVEARGPSVSGSGRFVAWGTDAPSAKLNYLSRGLQTWDEFFITNVGGQEFTCLTSPNTYNDCKNIFVSNTLKEDPEPGPYNPEDGSEKNSGEPLVKVERSTEKAGSGVGMAVTLKRPFDYHEFKGVEFAMPAGLGASTKIQTCTLEQAKTNSCPGSDGLKSFLKNGGKIDKKSPVVPNDKGSSLVGAVHADVKLLNDIQDIPPDVYYMAFKTGVSGGVYFGEPLQGDAGRLFAVVQDEDLMKSPIVVDMRIQMLGYQHYRLKVFTNSDIPNHIDDTILTFYKKFDDVGKKLLLGQQKEVNDDGTVKTKDVGTSYFNIERIIFTIWGNRKDKNGYPFMTNPTFSQESPLLPKPEKQVGGQVKNYGGTKNERTLDFPVDGAESLAFAPTLDIKFGNPKANAVTDMTVKVKKGLGQADLRKVATTLPKGVWVNGEADPAFCEKADAQAGACGKAGKSGEPVGQAKAVSPLVDGLTGDVFLIDAPNGEPLEMAIQLEGVVNGTGSVNMHFTCKVGLDSGKRVKVVCDDIPPYAVTEFELTTEGLLKLGGVSCSTPSSDIEADATLTAWEEGIKPVDVKATSKVAGGCGESDMSGFSPQLAVTSDDHTSGASPGKLELSVTRKASDDPITDFDLTLPQGMVGDLDATSAKCALSEAEGSGCPGSSKIGTVEATAQIFQNKTITVEGGLYNAVPGSGEFGRFIATFDLPEIAGGGKLTLKSAVNPIDNAQAIVTKVVGAPPEFSITNIKINLAGKTASGTEGPLLINPTFASNGSFTLDATSAHSKKASSSAPYPVTGSLGFAPHLYASLSTTKLGAKPIISTEIGQQVQETAIKTMRLSFKGFGLDITKGLTGCSALDRSLSACPPASKVADITAHSWLIPTPLQGSLYLGEGAKTAFMSLNGPITLNVDGDVSIDAAKGSVSVDINKGLPPISGSRIQATVNSGLFKNPEKCGTETEIALDALSYAGQSYTESNKFDFCKGTSSAASLKVKLKPRKANSFAIASFTLTQAEKKGAKKLKSLEIGLGKGKKALRASTKTLKRATRRSRKAKTIGTLSLTSAKKGRSVKANVRVKRGRIYLSPSSKGHGMSKRTLKQLNKIQQQIKKKTKIRISKGKLKLTGLPTTDAYYRISLTLNGKRFHALRNPKRPGKVSFNAKAKTSTGSSIKASYTVKVKRVKEGKKK